MVVAQPTSADNPRWGFDVVKRTDQCGGHNDRAISLGRRRDVFTGHAGRAAVRSE